MKKMVLSVFLLIVIAIMISSCQQNKFSYNATDGIYFKDGVNPGKNVKIPSEVNGMTVKKIGN